MVKATKYLLCFAILWGAPLQAQFIWAPGNNNQIQNWSSTANWANNLAPTNNGTADVVFANSSRKLSPNVDVAWSLNSILFGADASARTITGATLTIGSGGISQTTTATNTFQNSISLAANQTWSATNGGLEFTNSIALNNHTLTLNGSGAQGITLNSITGSGNLVITSGTVYLNTSLTNANLNITLAGGTLVLNGSDFNLGTLSLTGNSIIDFGSTNTNIEFTQFNANTFDLTVLNWQNTQDHFYATNWIGATAGPRGVAPMNQVTFSGWNANDTAWLDGQITPVPEPSTYGAIIVGLTTAFLAWRRSKNKTKILLAKR